MTKDSSPHVNGEENFISNNEILGLLRLHCEDLQPGLHYPHVILLVHVVHTCAEGLLAANDENFISDNELFVWKVRLVTVPEVLEELPPGRRLEVWDAKATEGVAKGVAANRFRAISAPMRDDAGPS